MPGQDTPQNWHHVELRFLPKQQPIMGAGGWIELVEGDENPIIRFPYEQDLLLAARSSISGEIAEEMLIPPQNSASESLLSPTSLKSNKITLVHQKFCNCIGHALVSRLEAALEGISSAHPALLITVLIDPGKPELINVPIHSALTVHARVDRMKSCIGINPAIVIRRCLTRPGDGSFQKPLKLFCLVGSMDGARSEADKVKIHCDQAGIEYMEIADFSAIDTSSRWLLYFIGEGGGGMLKKSKLPTDSDLLPTILSLPFNNCEGIILSCCDAASFLVDEEVITKFSSLAQRPRHIFANEFGTRDDIAAQLGPTLLHNLLTQPTVADAMRNVCIARKDITTQYPDQAVNYSWYQFS